MKHKQNMKDMKETFGLTDEETQKVSNAIDELCANPADFIAKLDEMILNRSNRK